MRLKEARGRRLLSVRALAERAGVSPTTVHSIERGKSRASFRAIRDISAALEMDPLEIDEFAAVIRGMGVEPRTLVHEEPASGA